MKIPSTVGSLEVQLTCDDFNLRLGVGFFDKEGYQFEESPVYRDQKYAQSHNISYSKALTQEGKGEHVSVQLLPLPTTISFLAVVVSAQNTTFGTGKTKVAIVDSESKKSLAEFALDDESTVTGYAVCKIERDAQDPLLWNIVPIEKKTDARSDRPGPVATIEAFSELKDVVVNSRNKLHMEIKVSEGKNLVAMDLNMSSDPYYKVFIDKEHVFTSEVILKNLNPKWTKYYLGFPFINMEQDIHHIRIEIWDEDRSVFKTSHDFMGQVTVALDVTKQNYEKRGDWFLLQKRKKYDDKVSGSIQLDVAYKVIETAQTSKKQQWNV